jgi:hypothetical protein
MTDKPKETPEQPSRAERIREEATRKFEAVEKAFKRVAMAAPQEQTAEAVLAVGVVLAWALSFLPEIAAELAEANSRDREAEIRAKNAEAFVNGIQAEIARAQGGLVVPAGVQVPGPIKRR